MAVVNIKDALIDLGSGGRTLGAALTDRVNVKNYGAVGNGTNDTAAVAAALAAVVAAGGGTLYFPGPGTYSVDAGTLSLGTNNNITIQGDGFNTVIQRRAAGTLGANPLIDVSGTSTGSRNLRCVIRDLVISGNDMAGLGLRAVYAGWLHIHNVRFFAIPDTTIDLVECWDSRFENIIATNVGTASSIVLSIRNSSSATPATFGYSTDNSNNLWFSNLHFETFKGRGIVLATGPVAGANANNITFQNVKMESQVASGGYIELSNNCVHIRFLNTLLVASGKDTGVASASGTTGLRLIEVLGEAASFDNTFINVFNCDAFAYWFYCWAQHRSSIRNVYYNSAVSPTAGAAVVFPSGALQEMEVANVAGTSGSTLTRVGGRTAVQTMSDADATLLGGTFTRVHRMTPTVARTVTLDDNIWSGYSASADPGTWKRIINNTGSAGTIVVKNLTSGGTTLKTIAANNYSDFVFDGTNWVLAGAGTL